MGGSICCRSKVEHTNVLTFELNTNNKIQALVAKLQLSYDSAHQDLDFEIDEKIPDVGVVLEAQTLGTATAVCSFVSDSRFAELHMIAEEGSVFSDDSSQ